MLAENCLSVYKGYLGTSGRFYKIPCVMMINLRLKGKKPNFSRSCGYQADKAGLQTEVHPELWVLLSQVLGAKENL